MLILILDYPSGHLDRPSSELEEYSSHLLFGLRHPGALSLYEQNAMQMVFQDLVSIHGNDAFAQSLYEFLQGSGKDVILGRVNELLFSKFQVGGISDLY